MFFKNYKKLFFISAVILALILLFLGFARIAFGENLNIMGKMADAVKLFSETIGGAVGFIENLPASLPNQIENQALNLSNQSQNKPAAPADDLVVQAGPNPSAFIEKPSAASNEIAASRTENAKTFDNHDGTYTYKAVIGLAHYKDDYSNPNEPWKDIDTSFYTDYQEYRLYDHLPTRIKIFKNKTGYEIESKRTGQKYTVELDEVEGAETAKKTNDADSDFEFEIKAAAVRLWKNLKTASAPKKFTWKVTKYGEGDLSFRENPEAFEIGTKKDIKINTKKTAIDENSFYWEETSPKTGVKIDTDVNLTVAAGSDDCYQDATWGNPWVYLYLSDTTIRIGEWYDDGADDQYWSIGGFRFLNVAIPQSATINSATISLIIQSSAGDPATIIKGAAADNIDTWSAPNTPNGATKTTASVNWTITGASGTATSPSIVSIIQEIVNRAGWVSGNALAITIQDNDAYSYGAGIDKYFYAYDNGSNYPSLAVTYTTAGGGTSAAATTTVILKKNTIFQRNVIFK